MTLTQQSSMEQRLIEGDERVLAEILRDLGPPMRAVLLRRYHHVLREGDIDDAISIGLYRMWANRAKFDGAKASLRVWLFRIVENAIRDVLRFGWHKARAMEVRGGCEFLADIPVNDGGQPDRESDAAESSQQSRPPTARQLDLREIIAALPERQRQIVLADAAAKDRVANSQRLAEEMEIPAATIRVYRKRAMDRIRKELKQRGHVVPD